MQTMSLNRRLDKIEELLNPRINLLTVFVNEDESHEDAVLRVAKQHGYSSRDEIPNDVLIYILDFYGVNNASKSNS